MLVYIGLFDIIAINYIEIIYHIAVFLPALLFS